MTLLIVSSAAIIIFLSLFGVNRWGLSIGPGVLLVVIIIVFALLAFLGFALRTESATSDGDWPPSITKLN